MKKENNSVWQNFIRALNLPEQTVVSHNHIELLDQHEIIVDDARSILEYEQDNIKILIRNKKLCISGQNLCINMFVENTMIIRGNITTVYFE